MIVESLNLQIFCAYENIIIIIIIIIIVRVGLGATSQENLSKFRHLLNSNYVICLSGD